MSALRQSYVHGASDAALLGETVGQLLDRIAAEGPDRPALVARHQNVRWSYAELRDRANDLAAGLIALGLQPGERIGIWSPNNAEWVLTQFATAKAGLILVNINPAYRLIELEHALRRSGCAALITAARYKNSDYLAMIRTLMEERRVPALRTVVHLSDRPEPGMIPFAELAKGGGAAERARLAQLAGALQFDDPINIQFT